MIRVLIVDDDGIARKGIISSFPWSNYNMKVIGDVQNGAEALCFLKQNTVELIFVDLDMPVMDGIEFISRSKESYKYINYVVLTFHESFSHVQQALRLGAVDYISKMQMEMESPEYILSRVNNRLLEMQPQSTVNTFEDTPLAGDSLEAWKSVQAEMESMFWLYRDVEYKCLRRQLEKIQAPSREMERLLIKISHIVSAELGCGSLTMPEFGMSSLMECLDQYREFVRAQLRKSTDKSSMAVCIMQAIDYIGSTLGNAISTEKMAKKVSMSRSYFCTVFKKYTGTTINEMIREMRMDHAEKQLSQSRLPIPEIAQQVGYEDANYFTKLFYECKGVTPSEFRRRAPAPFSNLSS